MKPIRFVSGFAIFVAGLLVAANVSAQSLTPEQMKQIDDAAAKFRSVQADMTVDKYTAIVQEHESQSGSAAFERVGKAVQMSMHLKAGSDDPETYILYKNGELDALLLSTPPSETILKAGPNQGEFDSMLTTGFGASSKELTDNWDVNFQGMESVDGVSCAKLDLVSKQQSVKNNFSHVTIWLDLVRDITLKQVMYQPDGDTRTATYSNSSLRYNKPVPSDVFTLSVPKGTQVTRR